MFVFVWSSRRSRLRALRQELSTHLFSVWFCTKHLHFALEGQGMPCEASPHTTSHGQRPPAGFCCHRQCILPASTTFCRSALHFAKMAPLAGRLLCIYFCRYFITAVLHLAPLHTVYGGISLFRSLSCKLYKTKGSIREGLLSWL